MSPELAGRVSFTPDLTPLQARVLTFLCMYAWPDGTHCDVGVATIREHTGLDRSSVYLALDQLRAGQWFTDIPPAHWGSKYTGRTINVDKLGTIPLSNAEKARAAAKAAKLSNRRDGSAAKPSNRRDGSGPSETAKPSNEVRETIQRDAQNHPIGGTVVKATQVLTTQDNTTTPSNAGGDLNTTTPFKGTAGEKIVSPPVPRSPPGEVYRPPPPRHPLRDTCCSFITAYVMRYGHEPLQDGKFFACMKRFVAAVGDDAPDIAAFYVQHSKRIYIDRSHDPSLLMLDAHALRTQWLNGRVVTSIDARDTERRGSMLNNVQVVKDMVLELEAQEARERGLLQ